MVSRNEIRRGEILAHLATYPGLTAYEVAVALGYKHQDGKQAASIASKLLRGLQAAGKVVTSQDPHRLCRGVPVNLWHVAPDGTPAPGVHLSPERLAARRQKDRASKRRERARARGQRITLSDSQAGLPSDLPVAAVTWDIGPLAACRDADPRLFFLRPGEDARPAQAICGACILRRDCLARARANGEEYGVWGGVDLGREAEDMESVS